jgi:uncharacterized membrane protein YraQ (UPF0718 family)
VHLNDLMTTLRYFVTISMELIILFVVISFFVGLLQEFIPDEKIRAVLQRPRKVMGNILGAFFGALTPFCSCSTIPVLVGLLNAGAPFGASMSFLLTSPVLNPIIIGLFLSLFGWRITVVYSLLVFSLAVIAGMVWERVGLESDVKDLSLVRTESCCASTANSCCSPAPSGPVAIDLALALNSIEIEEPPLWKQRVLGAYQKAKNLFVQVFPYLLLGAGIGALIYGFMPQDLLSRVAGPDNFFAVPVAAVIGIPMYIRAESIIPIGMTLLGKGMAMGTVAALVIGGAGASIPEVTLLASIFKPRLVIAFVATILLIACITGYVFNLVL